MITIYHISKINKMKDILEELKKYFEDTPEEKIKEDWEKLGEEWGEVGPTVEEYFKHLDTINKCMKGRPSLYDNSPIGISFQKNAKTKTIQVKIIRNRNIDELI